jgi:hypothetical protein
MLGPQNVVVVFVVLSLSLSLSLCRSKKLDHSIYSYRDLRAAYLERLQALHPDKQYSTQCRSSPHSNDASGSICRTTTAKIKPGIVTTKLPNSPPRSTKVDTEDHADKDRDFTLFCEREWRTETTNQACRGCFSSGSLEATSTRGHKSSEAFSPMVTSMSPCWMTVDTVTRRRKVSAKISGKITHHMLQV